MSRSSIIGCLGLGLALLVSLAAAPSVEAGAVYVPVATNQVIDGVRYQTQVWITNTGTDPAEFSTVFIPTIQDGTDRGEIDPIPVTVPPGGTFFLRSVAPNGARGLLEIDADPAMVVTGRLVSILATGEEMLGATIPGVAADERLAANETAHVLGVISHGDTIANLGVVNLGTNEAECTLRAFRINGAQIADTAVITLNPLTQVQFDDVLTFVGITNIADARFEASCDQPFYAYSTMIELDSGESTFVGPSTVAGSGIQPPDTGPPVPDNGECAANAECFRISGTVHVPRSNDRVKRVTMPVPPGSYRVIRASIDVTVADWAQGNRSGLHNIFWFARNVNRDLIGYVNVWGPNTNAALIRHGFNEPQHEKERIVRPLALQPGQTYHFAYLYDTDRDLVELVVRQNNANGNVIARMGAGRPDVNRVSAGAGDLFHIDFGFSGVNPKEPPTLGWVYKNLNVEFVR